MSLPLGEGLPRARFPALAQEVELVFLETQVGAQGVPDVAAGELLAATQAVQRHLVHRLAGDQRVAGVLRDAQRPAGDGGFQVTGGDGPVDQADPLGLGAVELVAEQQQLARLLRAVLEDLRVQMPGVTGQAEPLLGVAEPCVLRRDSQIDQLDQVDPRAGAHPLDLGDDGLERVVKGHIVVAQPPVLQQA